MRFKRAILISAGGLLIALAALAFTGSVVLFDPRREVISAHLVDGWGQRQPLLNVAFVRVGVPNLEGAVQITCKSDRIVKGGYVTPGAPTWQQVSGADCRRT